MQNASDSAAVAAAMEGGSNYAAVGQAVAAQYGFVNGSSNIVVTVSNPASATGCASNCYTASISDKVPLFLSPVVGYQGTTTVNSKPMTQVNSGAVATQAPTTNFCILALASSGAQGIRGDGTPNANLQGCNVMSDTSANCHGHTLNATYGEAHTTDSGCGNTQMSGVPAVADPYANLASNLPANTCGSGSGAYPQEPTKKKDPALPASNQWLGTSSLSGVIPSGVTVVCGDQQLTGNATINNTTLVIENGQLDTNGYTLSGSNLTVVFSGTNSASYQHVPTGSGTLDISSPSSGNWSGVAIYQDPSLTNGVNISAAGNSPTWDLSGLVYLPHSSVTLKGAVNKSSQGHYCFSIVVDNILVDGTGSIFANDTQCNQQGLTMPQGNDRGRLVN